MIKCLLFTVHLAGNLMFSGSLHLFFYLKNPSYGHIEGKRDAQQKRIFPTVTFAKLLAKHRWPLPWLLATYRR